MKSTIIKITLWIGIFALAYFGLYGNITNEIKVRKSMDKRIQENVQRLQDLREIQKQYKREKGHYAESSDSLINFLFNSEIAYMNTEKADADSIAVDLRKWKNFQDQIRKRKSNALNETKISKNYYKQAGGKWHVLTEQEKIEKGYISVEFFTAKNLIFTQEYQDSRNASFNLDLNTLSSIQKIFNTQNSENEFKKEIQKITNKNYEKLNIRKIQNSINTIFNNILNVNDSSELNVDELDRRIVSNKTEIGNLKKKKVERKDEKENANNIISGVKVQRTKYTELIGEKKIIKIRKKAKEKEDKNKVLKGRKGKIYKMLFSQDSTEIVNKEIIKNCKNTISNIEEEITSREQLSKLIKENIQCLKDVSEMQKGHLTYKNIKTDNFDSLFSFTLNEEIKIITTLKRGSYTIAMSPDLWKSAKVKADLFITESLGENILKEVNEKYKYNGGKWRNLTEEEGIARGLITIKHIIAKDVIYNDIYMSKRNIEYKLNLDSLIYVPHSKKKYDFRSKVEMATLQEQAQGEIDKYYFAIYTDYDNIFYGLDEEYSILQKQNERDSIMIGSLVKTITNGNWGE